MAQLLRFRTDDFAPADRLPRWDAWLWGSLAPISTRSMDGCFDGEASLASLGPLRVYRISASPCRLERRNEMHSPTGRGLAKLIVQHRGSATLTQFGREIRLEAGQWALCDAERPYSLVNTVDCEQFVLLLPPERLDLSSGQFKSQMVRAFGADRGTGRLVPLYLAALMDELGMVDEGHRTDLIDMATQLIRLSLFEARRSAPVQSMRETLRARVKDYVCRHLRDPALTIDGIAAAFGCTKRHLHNVFKEDALTLNQFIWSERLDRCREALGDPFLAGRSITEIAFTWGFNNSAHFSKAFKGRFGVPPGRLRAEHMLRKPALN